ncbi:hypothetical protein HYFRA_00004298 [Hymenoscyphus fraxineus]|uniref:C2H2-type domain-containing protein n=1 Tax=Hymenoscyphus fraxineus TaxID=746836 RepID=A0A9N9KN16_9HELO|nr:hypothetical protein HYFRA_00004298 [Hymenoscyphus fraxineus]
MAVQCSKCQKPFRIQADYNRHRKQHDRLFKCTICSRTFGLKTNLGRHMLSHIGAEKKWTIQCSWPGCKTKTVREDYLLKHMRKSHLEKQMTGNPDDIVRLKAKCETQYQQSVREARASAAEHRPTLHEAVANGDEEEVSRLLASGADVNAPIPSLNISSDYSIDMTRGGKWQETPLSLSVLHRRETIFRILLNINSSRKSLLWAFHACIRTDNMQLAGELIKKGVDVNEADTERGNCYPLEIAAAGNHKEILQFLLRRGAITEPSSSTTTGSPLIAAAGRGHAESVNLLLEHGADINLEGGQHGSALGAASYGGHEHIVNLLLEHGADINLEGGQHGSALGAASYNGNKHIVNLLLEHGADINLEGGSFGSALGAASFNGNKHIVNLLLEHGADINLEGGQHGSALGAASFNGNKHIVNLLLEHGADINLEGGSFGSALGAASKYGEEAVVKLLLDKGANPNIRSRFDGTPLRMAMISGNPRIEALLIEHGATE